MKNCRTCKKEFDEEKGGLYLVDDIDGTYDKHYYCCYNPCMYIDLLGDENEILDA